MPLEQHIFPLGEINNSPSHRFSANTQRIPPLEADPRQCDWSDFSNEAVRRFSYAHQISPYPLERTATLAQPRESFSIRRLNENSRQRDPDQPAIGGSRVSLEYRPPYMLERTCSDLETVDRQLNTVHSAMELCAENAGSEEGEEDSYWHWLMDAKCNESDLHCNWPPPHNE